MHHLIFEGAELSGKSWLMSQVYGYLEPKYNRSKFALDGCHWFNCDLGLFGGEHGRAVIEHYGAIFKELAGKNLLVEKFHLSDIVYGRLHRGLEIDYSDLEKALAELGFKIILCLFPEDEKVIAERLSDRLRLYPHYARIAQAPGWYLRQQREYLKEAGRSSLPHLKLEVEKFPDTDAAGKILAWLGEK